MKLSRIKGDRDKDASLPPRERGLKPQEGQMAKKPKNVAPPAGAWIETSSTTRHPIGDVKSLPPRERGLKLGKGVINVSVNGRSPRGSVD